MSEELLYQGQRLGDGGRYIIRQKKDEGGGGIIYLAFDQNLQMEVAVKQIKDGMPSYLESRVEVDILKKLSHQHLPKVLDFVEYDGTMFTVMNYIQGFSLAKALQNQGRFMQRDVLRWAIDISDALAYLHSQTPPVIHSDVKPGNIMYDPQTRQVTLIDFNISLAFKKN
jgi:serine/threonine-protein kinase